MASLHPTKTRLALLHLVSKEWIRREYSLSAGEIDMDLWSGHRATARIAEAKAAGWVELDKTQFSTGTHGFLVRYWRLTEAGRALLDANAEAVTR